MKRTINILLVEDDRLDVMDIKRTFDKMNLLYRLHVSKNGEEAIAALSNSEERAFEGMPDIVLIDINMPRMNGLELLQKIRTTDSWKHLKCFIITSSAEAPDKKAARELGVSGYVIKPLKVNNPASIDSFNLMIDLMNMSN